MGIASYVADNKKKKKRGSIPGAPSSSNLRMSSMRSSNFGSVAQSNFRLNTEQIDDNSEKQKSNHELSMISEDQSYFTS